MEMHMGPVTWEPIVAALKLTDAKGLAEEIEAEKCRREPGLYKQVLLLLCYF